MDNIPSGVFPVLMAVLGAVAGVIGNRNKKDDLFNQMVEDLRQEVVTLRNDLKERDKELRDCKQLISDLQDGREEDKRQMRMMQNEIDVLRSQIPSAPVPSGKTSSVPVGHAKKPDTGKLPPLVPPPAKIDMPDLSKPTESN